MTRHAKREEVVARPNGGPAPRVARAAERPRRRVWLSWLGLLALLAALGALLAVQRPGAPRYPNTIAEGADDAQPEIAPLLREASRVAGELVERFPDSPDALHAAGWAHQRFGKTQAAVVYWERCVELDPAFAPAHHALGTIAQEAGDVAKAAECFRRAAKLDPDSSSHFARLAESLMNAGELEEAARVLEEDLAARPKSIPSLLLIGQVYARLKEYEKARDYLETAVDMAPEYTSAYYALGTACAKLGDRENAKQYLDRFKRLKAQDEQAHRDMLKSSEDVAEVRTGLAELYTSAGKVYLAHGDVATAEQHLEKASRIAPNFAEPRQVLAWLYQQQGRTDDALRELAAVEEGATEDPAVCLNLGQIYAQLGMFEKAERAYRNLVEISPQQGGGYVALAGLYLAAGRKLAEAETLAEKAVELEPVAPHYRVLATARRQRGDRAGALAAIEEAARCDPGNPEYPRLRESMEKQHADAALPVAP